MSSFFAPPLKAELKFWAYSLLKKQGDDNWHTHEDVWQLDFTEDGSAIMEFDDQSIEMTPGDILIIPPGFSHAYCYDGIYGNWSMKFILRNFKEGLSPKKFPADKTNSVLTSAISEIFSEYYPRKEYNGKFVVTPEQFENTHIIESLLASLICRNMLVKDETPPIASRVREMLKERPGGSLKVEEAATTLGYSKGHFNALMKSHTGLNAKKFIDTERCRIAQDLLKYSDMNVNEVAEYMGFPDAFCFNKFFRRTCGSPPGKFKHSSN